MGDSIYIITKIDFDVMENRLGTALYSEILGYKNTNQEAEDYIKESKNKFNTYRGWDEKIYPQYNISKLKLL